MKLFRLRKDISLSADIARKVFSLEANDVTIKNKNKRWVIP
jgi:hypothetical protein